MNLALRRSYKDQFSPRLARAFNQMNLEKFINFYLQLKKLKQNRQSYRIDYVLKNTYPNLRPYSIIDIETFVNAQLNNYEN